MGYYSEVGLVLSKNGFAFFESELEKIEDEQLRKEVDGLVTCADNYHITPNGNHLWSWNYIKWYPHIRSIHWLEKCLFNMEYEDFYFICIGEEYDDVDVDGCYTDNSFNMEVIRTIQFDVRVITDRNSVDSTKSETTE